MKRHTVTYGTDDHDFVPSSDSVEIHTLATLRDREVHDSTSHNPEILHCWSRYVAEDRWTGDHSTQFEHLQTQLVAAKSPREIAQFHQFRSKPVRAGFRDAGTAAKLR